MWFKNLYCYRFTKPFDISAEALAEHLEAFPFNPCSNQQESSSGWVSPLGAKYPDYVHAAGGYIMVCLKRQDRVLPAAVVNEMVAERVEQIEMAEMRKVGRKEKEQIKDETIFTLMPRAFVRSSLLYGYIDVAAGMIVVNASSASRAETLLDALRESIGTLPVIPVRPKAQPQQLMTQWLLEGKPPENFEFGHECELRDTSERSGVVRCKNQDLYAEEINNHLQAGMLVSKLALQWNGGISCLVDDQMAIKRVTFDDGIQEQADQVDTEDAAAQFDVDFAIMTLELSRFLEALLPVFGGEDLPAVAPPLVAEPA
jgi:recombination associated protein RdgC